MSQEPPPPPPPTPPPLPPLIPSSPPRTPAPVKKTGRPRAFCDPFKGQYVCRPFAETTQGATTQEIADDTAAIHAAIVAVDARQPVPEYYIAPARRVSDAKDRFRVPPEVVPAIFQTKIRAVETVASPSSRIPGETATQIRPSARTLTKPAVGMSTTPAARIKEENKYSPKVIPAELEPEPEPEPARKTPDVMAATSDTAGPRRAPRRAVRANPAASFPDVEEEEEEDGYRPAKRAKKDVGMLVQREMWAHFGPRGKRGA